MAYSMFLTWHGNCIVWGATGGCGGRHLALVGAQGCQCAHWRQQWEYAMSKIKWRRPVAPKGGTIVNGSWLSDYELGIRDAEADTRRLVDGEMPLAPAYGPARTRAYREGYAKRSPFGKLQLAQVRAMADAFGIDFDGYVSRGGNVRELVKLLRQLAKSPKLGATSYNPRKSRAERKRESHNKAFNTYSAKV